jgi:hypothetical protein
MRLDARLALGTAWLAAGCVACSTLLGIDTLDAGPVSGDSAPPSDANGLPDATVADGGAETGPHPEGAAEASGGSDAGDSGAMPDQLAAADGSFATAPLIPWSITTAGAVVYATGNAQQNHLVVAANDARAWYFYIDDDTTTIKARVSGDYTTWSDGGALSLGSGTNAGLGSNFSVAYDDLGGTDIVHVVVSELMASPTTVHLRATITGARDAGQLALTSTATEVTNGTPCAVDGPATVIGSDGHVFDATGFPNNHGTNCDLNVYQSNLVDTAAGPWNATFTQTGYYVVSPGETSAHQLIPFAANGQVGGAYANGEGDVYAQVSWARTLAGSPDVWPNVAAQDIFPPEAGAAGSGEGYDDWALCRFGDTDVHALRHVSNSALDVSTFEHAGYDGTQWAPLAAPADVSSPFNGGLVLVSDTTPAHGMLLFVLGADRTTIYAAKWDPAAGSWLEWRAFPGATTKAYLAGSGCGSAHPMLFWSEAGSPQIIAGADVSGFLP